MSGDHSPTQTASRCPYCNGRGTVPLGLGSIGACSECGGSGTRWAVTGENFRAHGSGELSPETIEALQAVAAAAAEQLRAEAEGEA